MRMFFPLTSGQVELKVDEIDGRLDAASSVQSIVSSSAGAGIVTF
jgi:hypothetical protein